MKGDGTKRFIDLLTSAQRKEFPMCTGLVDYAPDALAAIAHVSFVGDRKHNPGKPEGEPPHHARGKSMDHPDCALRHLSTRNDVDPGYADDIIGAVFHKAEAAWRTVMDLQETMERVYNLPLAPAARVEKPQAQADDMPERIAEDIVRLAATGNDDMCATEGCVLKDRHGGMHVDADVLEQARNIATARRGHEGYPAGRCPVCKVQPCVCAAALANMPADEPGMTRAPIGSGAMVVQPEDFDAAD